MIKLNINWRNGPLPRFSLLFWGIPTLNTCNFFVFAYFFKIQPYMKTVCPVVYDSICFGILGFPEFMIRNQWNMGFSKKTSFSKGKWAVVGIHKYVYCFQIFIFFDDFFTKRIFRSRAIDWWKNYQKILKIKKVRGISVNMFSWKMSQTQMYFGESQNPWISDHGFWESQNPKTYLIINYWA